jgi:hypothetical protein
MVSYSELKPNRKLVPDHSPFILVLTMWHLLINGLTPSMYKVDIGAND